MGKVVKGIVMIAALVAIAVFVPQLIPLLGTSFATTVAGVTTLTTLGMVASALAITALSMAVVALLGPKPPKLNSSMGDRLNLTINPAAPRKIVFGKTAAGSDVRFQEKRKVGDDEDPDLLYQVTLLASHKINAIDKIYFEDIISYTGGAVTGKYSDGLQISTVLEGNSSNAAAFGTGDFWTASCKCTGMAYMKVRYKMDFEDIFPDGLPTRVTTVVEGCPVFDPRLATGYGGSGSHNPNNQSTWAYRVSTNEIGRNPALCLLTYMLGWKINGKLCWGMGIPPEFIDFDNFITYANVCDESVTLAAGGTTKRYQCDAIFDTGMTHEAVISAITSAMGTAKLVDTAGLYQLVGGYDDTDGPVLEFTADDLLGAYEWTPALPTRERFNIARGKFASPDDLYIVKEWGQVEIDPLPDEIPRTQEMDFAAVSRSATCQRIAKQRLLRNMKSGTFSCVFGPRAFGVQVGSLISLSLPAEGWNEKLFRVIDQSETVELVFQMILQEEHPMIYDWDNSEVPLPANVSIPSYDPSEYFEVDNLLTSATQYTNSVGGVESFIEVTWTPPATTATAIVIQSKLASETVWTNETSNSTPRTGAYQFRAPVGGLSTDVRARYRMHSGGFGPWATANLTAAEGGSVAPLTGHLTDESVTFAADSAGTISSGVLTAFEAYFRVYKGTTNVSTGSGTVYAVVSENGCDVSINSSTGRYTITSVTADTANAIFSATYGGVTIERVFSIAKSKAGIDGAGAKLLKVSADRQVISYNTSGSPSPTTQTTTFTATKQNSTATVTWSMTDATGVARTPITSYLSAATGDTVTMTESQFASGRNGTSGVIVTGTMTDGATFTDKVSVTRVTDGAVGPTGPGGPVIDLNASATAFTYIDGIPTSTTQSILLTVTKQNTSESVTWSTSPTTTLTGSGDTRTLTLANFGSKTQVTITVTGVTSGATDSLTIIRSNTTTPTGGIVSDGDFNGGINPSDTIWKAPGGEWGHINIP